MGEAAGSSSAAAASPPPRTPAPLSPHESVPIDPFPSAVARDSPWPGPTSPDSPYSACAHLDPTPAAMKYDPDKQPPQVIVSYASAMCDGHGKQLMWSVVNELHRRNITVFAAPMTPTGQDWDDYFFGQLPHAKAFVALFCPAYFESDKCKNELARAYKANVRILPLLFEVLPSRILQMQPGWLGTTPADVRLGNNVKGGIGQLLPEPGNTFEEEWDFNIEKLVADILGGSPGGSPCRSPSGSLGGTTTVAISARALSKQPMAASTPLAKDVSTSPPGSSQPSASADPFPAAAPAPPLAATSGKSTVRASASLDSPAKVGTTSTQAAGFLGARRAAQEWLAKQLDRNDDRSSSSPDSQPSPVASADVDAATAPTQSRPSQS